LAALELDSILFITSQVYNCNSLQRNLQFLGNRKGWFTQMPEIGDSFRRTWAREEKTWSSDHHSFLYKRSKKKDFGLPRQICVRCSSSYDGLMFIHHIRQKDEY
jgi:hypothetical protein